MLRAREAGLRRTRALEDVLSILIHACQPLTLADIAESDRLRSGADKATVYRLLMKLEERSLIRRLGLHDRSAYYILNLPGDEDFIRLPGLFRRWELNDVIELGADFHLEDAGEAADGTQLIAVYRRERRSTRNATTDSSSTTNPNKKEQ